MLDARTLELQSLHISHNGFEMSMEVVADNSSVAWVWMEWSGEKYGVMDTSNGINVMMVVIDDAVLIMSYQHPYCGYI